MSEPPFKQRPSIETATAAGVEDIYVVERRLSGTNSLLRLSNGRTIVGRRYIAAGTGERVRISGDAMEVFAKQDGSWIAASPAWVWQTRFETGPASLELTFKEIETDQELTQFESLRRFHYRGAGGAGRTVPLIATSDAWDLPAVLGFIELSSSMIANTARKRFFDSPFFESSDVSWREWNATAAKTLSNTIVRISRFVIHPELRGLGLAAPFVQAAKKFAAERWYYGGRRPRFIEITADMLRYYKFIGPDFAFMGETEGNEHRLVKDMTYLVKKARAEGVGMPQGGGGIMTLQRSYASRLMGFLGQSGGNLDEVVRSLQHDPAALDQETWEALHRLNRKPKLSFISGLTPKAEEYVRLRKTRLQNDMRQTQRRASPKPIMFRDVSVVAKARISQSSEARALQDAFGFVGQDLTSDLIDHLSFNLVPAELTLVCGASGSGKSLLLRVCEQLLAEGARSEGQGVTSLQVSGSVSRAARVAVLPELQPQITPLEAKGRASLEAFLQIAAKCGLAEPQLFVRPVASLSSGQRYRLRMALAFLSNPEVVIIDNFCEPLDRYTSIGVIRGLKRLAAEARVAVLAATAAYDRHDLFESVDQWIMLRRGERALVKRGAAGGLQEGLHGQPVSGQKSK